jgi:hypothetical protein
LIAAALQPQPKAKTSGESDSTSARSRSALAISGAPPESPAVAALPAANLRAIHTVAGGYKQTSTCHICTGTGLTPCPRLRWDRARCCHICTGTGLAPATSAPGPRHACRRIHAKSDLLALLKAIGAYEFDGCRDAFCFENGLNAKTMREIHALRTQLVRIIRAVRRPALLSCSAALRSHYRYNWEVPDHRSP